MHCIVIHINFSYITVLLFKVLCITYKLNYLIVYIYKINSVQIIYFLITFTF